MTDGRGTERYVECRACTFGFYVPATSRNRRFCEDCRIHRLQLGRKRWADGRRDRLPTWSQTQRSQRLRAIAESVQPYYPKYSRDSVRSSALTHQLARTWPSVAWGEKEWYAALRADEGLYLDILDGIFAVMSGGRQASGAHRRARRERDEQGA